MKCKNCPFTLLCYTGYFSPYGRSKARTMLCPTCYRLICQPKDSTIVYTFFCEQRKITAEMKMQFDRKIGGTKLNSLFINDPVVKHTRLYINECFKCSALFDVQSLGVTWKELE